MYKITTVMAAKIASRLRGVRISMVGYSMYKSRFEPSPEVSAAVSQTDRAYVYLRRRRALLVWNIDQ